MFYLLFNCHNRLYGHQLFQHYLNTFRALDKSLQTAKGNETYE